MNNTYIDRIVRIEDKTKYGLTRRDIYGLNILRANGIEVSIQNDPFIAFLKLLSASEMCAACVGYLSLKDMVDDPVEMFGEIEGKADYVRVPLGLYGGTFYDLVQYPTQDACYFPHITSSFWDAKNDYDNIRNIFDNDAISLMVGVNDTDKIERILASFTTEEALQQELSSECRLVVTSGGNGTTLSVYTSDIRFFSDLDQPLMNAVKAITDSDWYSHNKDNLVWNSDGYECLLLP